MNKDGFLGSGWSFPPAFDNSNYQLRVSSGENNIKQSIDLLLQTPKGSRSLMPNFGSDLFRYVFTQNDASLQAEIINSVKQILLDNEPRIQVENVDVSSTDDINRIEINIIYYVINTNSRHNHVFPFSLLEGTNIKTGL
jgi:phage baseplate assembly protein W